MTAEIWLAYTYLRCRERSRRRGWNCSITPHDLLPPERCPSCKRKLTFDTNTKNTYAVPDRLFNVLGYVRGNVNIICLSCNSRKNNKTPEEIIARAKTKAPYGQNKSNSKSSRRAARETDKKFQQLAEWVETALISSPFAKDHTKKRP